MQGSWFLTPQMTNPCERPNSCGTRVSTRPLPYVCLKSKDGMEFIIPEAAARQSKMLAMLLDAVYFLPNRGGFEMPEVQQSGGRDHVHANNNINNMPCIPLDVVSRSTLYLVCHYLVQRSTSDVNSTDEFSLLNDLNPLSNEDQDVVVELLTAADFLDC
uniref:Elongin-C n=1 Tax=Trypanosoma congolense (strain IL3000) TaxID=1068625 RepID=F9WCN9_TRYCI|nr:unnamed protein product [Trypanosoma congolense IL3000]